MEFVEAWNSWSARNETISAAKWLLLLVNVGATLRILIGDRFPGKEKRFWCVLIWIMPGIGLLLCALKAGQLARATPTPGDEIDSPSPD